MKQQREKPQIVTLEKLETENVSHFCSIKYLKSIIKIVFRLYSLYIRALMNTKQKKMTKTEGEPPPKKKGELTIEIQTIQVTGVYSI